MKKIFVTLFAVAVATLAMAQQNNPQQMAKTKLAQMDKVLDMTPEQEKKMMPVLETQARQSIENKKLQGTPEFQQATKASYQEFMRGMKSALTPEQNAKWRQHLDEAKARREAAKKK